MINSVYSVCNIIANKNNYGVLTPQRFNELAKNAQIKIVGDLIDQTRRSKSDKNNALRLREIEHTLSVFYQNSILYRALSGSTILDYFSIPDDCMFDIEYTYIDDSPITLVSNQELSTFKRMRDMKPTMSNIYGTKYGNKVYIYPSEIGEVGGVRTSDITIGYYKHPEDPSLNYISGVLDVSEPYDFELPLQYHDKLVVEILLAVGISIREEQIYVYARNERQQEINNENA